MILPNTDSDGAFIVAEAIRLAVVNKKILHEASDVKPYVTLNLGVYSAIPQSKLSPIDFVNSADTALYQAKEQGRNKTIVFVPTTG